MISDLVKIILRYIYITFLSDSDVTSDNFRKFSVILSLYSTFLSDSDVTCATLLFFFTYTLANSQLRVILILLSDSDVTLLSLPGATTHRAVFLFRSTTSTSLSWEAGSAIGAVLFFPPLRADPVALQPVLVSDLSSLTWTVDCH